MLNKAYIEHLLSNQNNKEKRWMGIDCFPKNSMIYRINFILKLQKDKFWVFNLCLPAQWWQPTLSLTLPRTWPGPVSVVISLRVFSGSAGLALGVRERECLELRPHNIYTAIIISLPGLPALNLGSYWANDKNWEQTHRFEIGNKWVEMMDIYSSPYSFCFFVCGCFAPNVWDRKCYCRSHVNVFVMLIVITI